MRIKSETFDIFQKFIGQVDCQSGKKLKHLRPDFEGEITNEAFEEYISKEVVK